MGQIAHMIYCNGRIKAGFAPSGFKALEIASQTATELVSHYGDKLVESDLKRIVDVQHEMVDLAAGTNSYGTKKVKSGHELADEMFALLEALEKKMSDAK